ncbi:site-2 protease family protein [Planktothrix rubescens]|uniref:site-2 protease family protein n=1 Tax=Planktothrix rubescens TaxID=59512 RepID=UPI000420C3F0|nr:site-2 protease family protein [Planktothrix rubescens]
MQAGWRIGSLFGIPFFVDSSWFVIVLLFTVANRQSYAEWGQTLSWVAGFAIALLLFASVLLHELGHSLVAQSQGIRVNSITLFLFGGVAAIDKESKTPGQAFQVAIAGPLVSFSLFFILNLVTQLLPNSSLIYSVVGELARINLVLGIFNLIPGLPLDGGQVLKATVWKITGNRLTGVRWAAKTGQFLGILAISLGLSAVFLARSYGGLWIALIGWFILQNAASYNRITDLQEALVNIQAGDTMTREFRVVDADLSLRQFADEYLIGVETIPVYFASSNGRYRGLVSVESLRVIERSQWEKQTLNQIVQPLNSLITVSEKASLVEVINLMEDQELRRITILSPAVAVAGIIDRGDVVRSVANYLKVPIPEANIRRIKEEGIYPPGLQLAALAKSMV